MTPHPLYTTSFRGIGRITLRELQDAFGTAVGALRTGTVRDYDLTRFAFSGPVPDLLRLGTAEDLFYELAAVPLSGSRDDLASLRIAARRAPLEPALACHLQTVGKSGKQRPAFRVVVQAEDAPWRTYRRLRMQQPVEQGLRERYPRWKPVEDNAALEFWVQQTGKQALIGLRLSDRRLRHRTYKIASLPASLRPTIARALVVLSGIDPADTFLDPMCGAGTILLERALAGRYRLLLGGDIHPEAVECTRTNFGNRHKPRDIRQWDATALPLPAESVDKAATNLPWGRQMGSSKNNRPLYAGVLSEIGRVLKPGGRAVFLTSAWDLLKKTLTSTPGLNTIDHIQDITVLGRRADVFVVIKK